MNLPSLTNIKQAAQLGNEAIHHLLAGLTFPLVESNRATFLFHGRIDSISLQHWVFGLPSQIPLERLANTDWWALQIELPLQSRIEYKFVAKQGGHDHWLIDPRNPRIARDPFGGNSVVQMTGYQEPEWSLPKPDVPKGSLETFTMRSDALESQREIRVYLPARFRTNRRHRLLIMHDGDDYMQYSRLGAVLDNLTQRWEIPPLVVVLLNPHDRLREYGADPRHAKFVVQELLPEIEARYPVIRDPSARCLGGASFGGVASLSTAWHYPGVFDMLLLQSGSFAFTDIGRHTRGPVFDPVVAFMNRFRESQVTNQQAPHQQTNLQPTPTPQTPSQRVFMSCGVYESLIYENRSLVPLLQRSGTLVKFEEVRDGHNWENWRDRLRSGLTWLFPVPLWFYYE